MDFLIGAIFIYSAYIHYPYYKSPERTGRPEIQRMAITIMLVAGGYGLYKIWGAMGGMA